MTTNLLMLMLLLFSNPQTEYKVTSSGLQYKIVKEGNNKHPQNGYRVWLEYTGKLDNDSVFATTEGTGNIDVWMGQGKIIKAWEEALPMIGEGGEIDIIAPPSLGYGNSEVANIPKNSTLHFNIKILQVDSCAPIKPYNTNGLKAHKLKNGIKYYIVEPGIGSPASKGDNVYIHYTGWLPNKTIYTSTIHNNNPMRFTAGQGETIEGMDTALMLIPQGGKYRFVIPNKLAFGKEGYRNIVPPRSTITLDIDMVRISHEVNVTKWDATGYDTITTASGLQYVMFEEGYGDKIKLNSIVTAHYSAYFSDGTLFDSSVKRESPIRYPVGAGLIVDGFEEATLLMRKGSKFQLIIPPHLAYGEAGDPPYIPANSQMIFDVEIIDVIE